MKFLSLIWLVLLSLILTGCNSGGSDTVGFTKQVDIFGIHIYATANTGDDKVLHAANVLAEYLDNDEDGIPDNQKIVDAMVSRNAALVMGKTGQELRSADRDALPPGPKQGLWDAETIPNGAAQGKFDASLEEILHLISDYGYGCAYPSVFGARSGTEIAKAVDIARGGHFEEIPEKYPDDAWYSYYDKTCSYNCQLGEYIYWVFTSILGAQDFSGRYEQIKNEWRLNTKEKVREGDPAAYALFTDPQYKLPTVLPDGKYRAKRFTIQKYP